MEWTDGTSAASLRRRGGDRIRLLPGVADRLVTLGPLLRPLIELHWTRDVARWTGLAHDSDHLHDHLFGSARVAFPRSLKAGLVELQNGECFYCGTRLCSRVEVDHFLARSRWPNDAIENLVIADHCNLRKSDHFAAESHAHAWAHRVVTHRDDLRTLAETTGWTSAEQRTVGLVANSYLNLAPLTPLWVSGNSFENAQGPVNLYPQT